MANPKCLPRLPWPKWAEEANLPDGYKSTDNWHAFERWAQTLLDECIVSGGGELCASFEGMILSGTASLVSTRYYPPGPWSITQLRASLDGNQVGDIEFTLMVNGVNTGFVTIPSLANYGEANVSMSGTDGDYLQWAYVSGANNGSLLTLQGIGSGVSAGLDMLLIVGG